jgi:hypothetical protein
VQEELEDTRNRKSMKNRQHNSRKKKNKKTKNDIRPVFCATCPLLIGPMVLE